MAWRDAVAPTDRRAIAGVVVCGGLGTRMGGADKGLQLWRGEPLAQHALRRLAPQVGTLLVNANRNLDAYAVFGVPVVADTRDDRPGPLAGWLAALAHTDVPWLAAVPCDAPRFPADLVERLAGALRDTGAAMAVAATGEAQGAAQPQPVFGLLHRELAPAIAAYLDEGGRSVRGFAARVGAALAVFDDAAAFANANTADELVALDRQQVGTGGAGA